MPKSRLLVLKKALQLENDGMVFYAAAMQKSTSLIGRQMFDYLHRSEKDHIQRIRTLYHALEQSGSWPETTASGITEAAELQRKSIFGDAIKSIQQQQSLDSDDLDALKQAAEFERSGEHFYAEQAKRAEDPFEQAFYRQLAQEEDQHLRAIEDSILMLEDPQGFFAQYEKGTLAG
ncbi:MAG: ferritin family protein [Motiliproteus sp.]